MDPADDLTPDHARLRAHLRADLEQDALEAAYGDEIRKLFGRLVDNAVEGRAVERPEGEALDEFRRGLADVRQAWELAGKELQRGT